MNSQKQMDALYEISQAGGRRANRALHHSQTILFWLGVLALVYIGIVQAVSEGIWVWIPQGLLIVIAFLVALIVDRTYLIWPDFAGRYDDLD